MICFATGCLGQILPFAVLISLAFLFINENLLKPPCTLTALNQVQLDDMSLNETRWNSMKAIRSIDSTIAIKILAYLDFQQNPTQTSSEDLSKDQSFVIPVNNLMQNLTLDGVTNLESNETTQLPQTINQRSETGRVGPQTGTIRRHLPLKLLRVNSKQLKNGKHKYQLHFSCITLTLILTRTENGVYIEQMSLHFSRFVRKFDSCDLTIPDEKAFLVPIDLDENQSNSSFAHYHCNKANLMRFSCRSKHRKKEVWLADLQIQRIEFETNNYLGIDKSQALDFKSLASECLDWCKFA